MVEVSLNALGETGSQHSLGEQERKGRLSGLEGQLRYFKPYGGAGGTGHGRFRWSREVVWREIGLAAFRLEKGVDQGTFCVLKERKGENIVKTK